MNKLPAKLKRAPRKIEPHNVQLVERAAPSNSSFSFSYAYQEMHLNGGRTKVKSKKIGFEDGRIISEQFEGIFPAALYERTLGNTQRTLADQTISLMKQFSFLLPSFKK